MGWLGDGAARWSVVGAYVLVLSCLAFGLTAWDKRCAIRHRRRVPEAVLLTAALLGGSPGTLLAMLLCHHKTRKPKFIVGVPLILAAQLALLYWLS